MISGTISLRKMNNPIRFAGLGMVWTSSYTASYAKYLEEIGYSTKIIGSDKNLVAYAYRPFTLGEVETALSNLEGNKQGLEETSS